MSQGKVLISLWLLVMVSGTFLDFWHEKQFLPPPEERTSNDALVDVFGEMKTVAARYLWFRMDIYHEAMESQGVLRDKSGEVLPLLRMMTLLSPEMTDSYDQIVWDLYAGFGDRETALEILEEGIRKNPESYELQFRKALIYYKEGDFVTAGNAAAQAIRLTRDQVRMVDSLRLIYWSAKELGRVEIQKRAIEDLLGLRPNDPLWLREKATLSDDQSSPQKTE